MILGIGEILLDLIVNFNNDVLISGKIGGAPFNVVKFISLLNEKCVFYGIVGEDEFGKYIINKVNSFNDIDSYIEVNKDKNTTLALINKSTLGNEKYSFYRKNTADFSYFYENLIKLPIDKYSLIHFGSLFLSDEKAIETISKFINYLKSKNKILSIDINYREDIFANKLEAISRYNKIIDKFDIIKFSLNELNLLSGSINKINYINNLLKKVKVIIVTNGKRGSTIYTSKYKVTSNAYNVKAKGTIGAGDSFLAGALYLLDKLDLTNLSNNDLNKVINFASATSALVCLNNDLDKPYNSINDINVFIKRNKINM